MARFLGFLGKPETAEDPVCHMQVEVKKPGGGTYDHQGTTYYFCGPGCRGAFSRDPETYLSGEAQGELVQGHEHKQRHQGSPARVDVNAPWGFKVKVPVDLAGYADVEYQCPCGCRPGARYQLGSQKGGSEHCCCGRVHFAGENADAQIRAYIHERAKTKMDEDVGPYVYGHTEVVTPFGVRVLVAYAQPTRPRK